MYEVKHSPVDSILRDQTERNRPWIEQTLSAPLADTLQLELPYNLSRWAARYMLPKAWNADIPVGPDGQVQEQIAAVLLPPDAVPSIKIERKRKASANDLGFDCYFASEWLDCPMALSFIGLQHPVVVLNAAYISEYRRHQKEVAILRRDSVEGLIEILELNRTTLRGPRITVYGEEPIDLVTATWDEVIMDQTASRLLRDDFLSFLTRREWFRAKKLPFRRGYLLHGPPGNGKTSAIRAMLSYPGVSGYSIDLMHRHIDDSDLRNCFKEAAANAPAIILFEDIDRFFTSKQEKGASQVSMQQLLNCIDGVDTLDGVIVVATANNPEALDTAILRRPGRFDRVVEFGNPSEELRKQYLQGFCPDLVGEDLDICAVASEGLSFAQLREAYILAAQTAYEADREVTPDDISSAIALLQVTMNRADRKRTQKSGFEADFGSRIPMGRG